MPVAKLRPSGVTDTIKSEEGNQPIDTFIRQAIGKEHLLSFSRTGDSPGQWIQLFHALDQQDLPGCPLFTPLKVQTQKCEKCSLEFCSPINYRRHTRVHRRSFNANKEPYTSRDLLGAFWDKLSLDEAKEIISFKDVNLEGVPGPSIVRALTSLIRKPGFFVFPQVYVRAGSILLDIIQYRPSSLPMSSEELFSILDAASEGTFLCAGTAESIKKYVFDGEAAKIGLEMKNLVACTSFLIEQKLVKAWLADKDAEALRCQKLLVEEEEAAQRRQAALLARKRQKKLLQKEQKAKGQTGGGKEELEVTFDTSGSPLSEEVSSPLAAPESDLCTSYRASDDIQILIKSLQFSNREDEDTEAQLGFSEHVDSTNSEWVKNPIMENNHQHVASAQWLVAKTHRGGQNGFHTSQNLQVMKRAPIQKHAAATDPRGALVVNIGKVWTRKSTTENDGQVLENRIGDTLSKSDENNCKVMIGSICVPVRKFTVPQKDYVLADAQNNLSAVQGSQKMNNVQLFQANADSVQCGDNRSIFKLWRPVKEHETSVHFPVQSGSQELGEHVKLDEVDDQTVNSKNCQQSCGMDNHDRVDADSSCPTLEEHGQAENLLFSSNAAKAFLAQRWKEAISADHVRLVLSPELESLGSPGAKGECQLEATRSDCQIQSINGNADNQPSSIELF